ncbi:hypothetical protein THRCLA_02536 [Thraustotheca clavata]|uniref:Uncharacterized protein n=1 Tax=Thraustotheca clavata TaxID=74557 RepID=A0A1W0A521_9STRA|nr:hypothetical protein THRCLA_02536 [Thraustotheca clavata]
MSIGIPLGMVNVLYDHMWLNTSILLGRYLGITSLVDFLVNNSLQLTFRLSLYTLSSAIRVEDGHKIRRKSSMSSIYSPENHAKQMKALSRQATLTPITRYSHILAAVTAGASIASTYADLVLVIAKCKLIRGLHQLVNASCIP